MGRGEGPSGEIAGILNVFKPTGMTSHDVVDVVRRAANTRRVGHAGTLDPAADGVLLVGVGKATRVTEYLMAKAKSYRAAVRFGASSTTDDLEGVVTLCASRPTFAERDLRREISRFVGDVDQVPPAYSAIKVAGRPLYERARAGETVSIPPRRIHIDDIEIESFRDLVAVVHVTCSKGTYIRALARDLGLAFKTCAFLESLTRTRSGDFLVDNSLPLDVVRRAGQGGYLDQLVFPVDAAVADWRAVVMHTAAVASVRHGSNWTGSPNESGGRLRAYDEAGQLVALLEATPTDCSWHPTTVFVEDRLDDIS